MADVCTNSLYLAVPGRILTIGPSFQLFKPPSPASTHRRLHPPLRHIPDTQNTARLPACPPPAGLPCFTAGWWLPMRDGGAQLTLAVLICLIDAVEACSMAKSLAARNGYEVDATQDLRGGLGCRWVTAP